MNIIFTKHALDKFAVLERHSFTLTKEQVVDAIEHPELVDESRWPLLIAQKSIDRQHVLRVVYRQEGRTMVVITFYPGRKKQDE